MHAVVVEVEVHSVRRSREVKAVTGNVHEDGAVADALAFSEAPPAPQVTEPRVSVISRADTTKGVAHEAGAAVEGVRTIIPRHATRHAWPSAKGIFLRYYLAA